MKRVKKLTAEEAKERHERCVELREKRGHIGFVGANQDYSKVLLEFCVEAARAGYFEFKTQWVETYKDKKTWELCFSFLGERWRVEDFMKVRK
jgi:hypothetical protein